MDITLFRTNVDVILTLFRTNIDSILTLFGTNVEVILTLFGTNGVLVGWYCLDGKYALSLQRGWVGMTAGLGWHDCEVGLA